MLHNLGKYKIVSELGRGGMGVVYRAEDPDCDRTVALKVLPPNLASDPELVHRFKREARSAARLKHPNIVVIYESSQVEDTPFIAMEFLEGETLGEVISSRTALPLIRKLDIIIQASRGLDYAHRRQVVHRDVKPSNILIEPDGPVKILDFGIAHLASEVTHLTLDGQIIGTPSYMSPEQMGGRPVDARTDIFSLGAVLYELLTYRKAFPGKDYASLLFKIQNEQPPPLSEMLPTCAPELQRVVSKALAKNREERYQTAEDLAFDLQQVSEFLKHDMIEDFLERGRRSLEEGNLAVAKESIQQALEIDSSHDIARGLFDQVQAQIEVRRRVQRVEEALSRAKGALEAGQFDQAVALLDEVLQLDPTREEARHLRTIAAEQRDQAEKISRHMDRAERLNSQADLQAAIHELESILALDRNHAGALRLREQILHEVAEQERQRRLRQYTQEARVQLARKNLAEAGDLLDKVLTLDPINIEAEALLRQVRILQERERERQRREERLAGIQEALGAQAYDQAVNLAAQALAEFPGDAQVLKLHAQALRLAEQAKQRTYVEEQLQSARSFLQRDQYPEAVSILQSALERLPGDVRLVSYLKTVQEAQHQAAIDSFRRQVVADANARIRERDFAAAIATLEDAHARLGESPEIIELLKFAREEQDQQRTHEQIQETLAWAQVCLHDQNFEEAVRVLELAQPETTSGDLDELLTNARLQQQQFEQQRVRVMQDVRQLLEAGEAEKAIALLDSAPAAFRRNQEYQRLNTECREGLERIRALNSTLADVESCLASGDLVRAEKVLGPALRNYPHEPALLDLQKRLEAERLRLLRAAGAKVLDAARAAVSRGDYGGALDVLHSLPPEAADLPDIAPEARTLQAQAGQGERELKVRQQVLRDAQEHLSANRVAAAIALLEKTIASEGASRALVELLQHANERKSAQDRQNRVQQLLTQAQQLQREYNYDEAVQILEQGQKELDATEIETLLASVREQWRQFEQGYQETLARVRHLLASDEALKAQEVLDAAPRAYLRQKEFSDIHAECKQRVAGAVYVKATLKQFEGYIAAQDFTRAEALMQRALQAYPHEAMLLGAQKHFEEARRRWQETEWRKVIAEAKASFGSMAYQRAITLLSALPKEAGAVPELASEAAALLEEAHKGEKRLAVSREAVRVAQQQLEAGEYVRARGTINQAIAVAGPSAELARLLKVASDRAEQARQERLRRVLEQAHQFLRDEKYDEAVDLLEEARHESGAQEVESFLSTVQQRRQLARNRDEIIQQARTLLAAGDAAQAMARLDHAPKTLENDELRRIRAACSEALDRANRIHSERTGIEALLGTDVPQARARLDQALKLFPNEPTLLALQGRVQEEESKLRHADWTKRLETAREALDRREHQESLHVLETLPSDLSEAPELESAARNLRAQALHREQQWLHSQKAIRAATEQINKKEFARAISTLEQAAAGGASAEVDALLRSAQDGMRQQRARHRDQLLAIEARIASTSRSKLKRLAQDVRAVAGGVRGDDELATLAARVSQRLEAQIAAPAVQGTLPWGRIAMGVTALVAVLAAIELGPRIFTKRTVSVEIQTNPPGALVRIGEKSCIAPDCRFELLPGKYGVEAELNGFQSARQALVLDSQRQLNSFQIKLLPVVATPSRPVNTARERPPALQAATGTLVVRAGLPDVLVYVDKLAPGHTDAQGSFTAQLEPKAHRVRVQKDGYDAPSEQPVEIARGEQRLLTFALRPQATNFELRGAPAGVEIRLGATSLGRTDGSSPFSLPVPPGDQVLQVVRGPATRQITQSFPPGHTIVAQWQSIAPPEIHEPPKPPTAQEIEALDWERARTGTEGQVQDFLQNHPNGLHAREAQRRLQDLFWERTNRQDVNQLQAYLKRFPDGPHSAEASSQLADIVWGRLDRKDSQALGEFAEHYPNSPHRAEAEQLRAQVLQAQGEMQRQREAEGRAIRAVLVEFNAAFEAGKPRDVKAVWPKVPDRYTEGMRLQGNTFVMALQLQGEPQVNGDVASAPCQLVTKTSLERGKPTQTQKAVTVTLRKLGDHWSIVDPFGAR
jgi:hypothetical protein